MQENKIIFPGKPQKMENGQSCQPFRISSQLTEYFRKSKKIGNLIINLNSCWDSFALAAEPQSEPSRVELGSSIIFLVASSPPCATQATPALVKGLDYEIVNGRMTEKISGSLPSVETLPYFRLLRCFFIFI